MDIKKILLTSSWFVFPSVMWANMDYSVVATVSAGPAWNKAGQTQTLLLQPDFFNTYQAKKSTQTIAIGELFLGLQRRVSARLLGQLGLAIAATSQVRLQGDIWETANPVFNNFTYRYDTRQTRASIKGKFFSEAFSKTWLPYLGGSLGAGFNKTYHFSSTPRLFETIQAPAFQSNKNTAFTYTVEIGIQKTLNQHWQTGLGYQFADWGCNALARAIGQTLGTGLQLNHVLTQQLQFNMSYIS